MDWIAGNNLYKSSPYTGQQQQSTIHAVNIYNTQYRISYSKIKLDRHRSHLECGTRHQ
jgi:hypothetical protein